MVTTPIKQNYSSSDEASLCTEEDKESVQTVKDLQEVLNWLKTNNFPVLPVAPAQPADQYPARDKDGNIKQDKQNNPIPAFTGKNPSYLDSSGRPHLVNHRPYQKRLPTPQEIETWFANPLNGIGTLGGWNDTIWLDFDVKKFPSEDDCTQAVTEVLQNPTLANTFLERSHSGGWRVGVRVKEKPSFTNFALQPGGKHIGEALGEGRFTVLAPTVGPSGNPYQSINRVLPAEVESLESIGIYSTSTKRQHQGVTPQPLLSYVPGNIPLEELGNTTSREILKGSCPTGDRSEALATALNEWYGWQNWGKDNDIPITGTPEDLAHYAGGQLGIDSERVERILKTIDIVSCNPAALHRGGEESCWKKIRRLSLATFKAKCPAHIQSSFESRRDEDSKKRKTEWGVESKNVTTPDSFDPVEEFTQRTLFSLYGDKPWICVDNRLYAWTGTYYKLSKDAVEIKRLADFCNTYPVIDKQGELKFPYAKPSKVKEALEWVKMRLSVDPDLVNPPGINCTNGVLHIHWNRSTPSWELVEHDPDFYYIYKPLVTYNPKADSKASDRLLEVLDAPQRDIFLKTIAASLDLETVRKYKGRLVRALLFRGHGSNGKDTLREAVSAMYGHQGMTGCTLSDFAAYDEGRKFPLARLRHSRVNWASENASTARLDKIQSLKAFITGDTLDSERKGKDAEPFKPNAIGCYNINDTPNLQGTLEAISGRYAVIYANKTFKIGADPTKGEIEADPRFKDDPEFLCSEVLPAFLNRVLEALQRLMAEGIDYSCTEKALEDIQVENSHLFQFCKDTGLNYDPVSVLTASDIWTRLEQWYLENGTLTYESGSNGKERAIWAEQSKHCDRNVKAVNQVIARFRAIFPKTKLVTVPHESGKKTLQALQGLSFGGNGGDDGGDSVPESPTPISPHPTPIPPQSPPQQTTENQDFHPTHPNLLHGFEKLENSTPDPGDVEQKLLENILEKSMTPQNLGWVGCDAQESSFFGVENCGGTGVEIAKTGVEIPQEVVPDTQASLSAPSTERSAVPNIATAAATDELESWLEYHQVKKPYPNPKSDNLRSSQKRAFAIREAYRAGKTKEDLSALPRENGGKFSKEELVWVSNWLYHFFPSEYHHVQATSKISQQRLLE
ncbi:MAG: bifunctional DNA primase/polymerase [Symplocastrum torsivum CPER-KK1]|jgi:phage/plasmid-associated DNA primase|uniref:Bifunctional DNA primase/polymerase n=1 Tax=Symplocastrum torsivum CPER-KK1 TaxID=450513 RepID=A0A951UC89_9CYAN|nr:bifunctional DNA primase/polymerase [Symplocastrum torsivum CPER-KK1]